MGKSHMYHLLLHPNYEAIDKRQKEQIPLQNLTWFSIHMGEGNSGFQFLHPITIWNISILNTS